MNARARVAGEQISSYADVTDLAHDGRGVAHVEGKAVFIDDALPGERVEWRRTKRGSSFDEGRLIRVVEPSPHRVAPRCAHFGTCGGCALQHLASAQQLEFKRQQLVETLSRVGQVAPLRLLPALATQDWRYRRRARLGARWVPKKQRTVVGFRERSTSYIADLRGCEILAEPVNALIEPLSQLISALSVRARLPQIEVAVADDRVALVIRVLDAITETDREKLLAFERAHRVDLYLQPGGYDTVAPLSDTARSSMQPLEYRLAAFDVSLRFAPTDFVQIHGTLNAAMVERALEQLSVSAGDRVLDLFCGLGNFSLPLARRGASVTAVEGEAGLVARARENASRNGLESVRFHTANLADPATFQDSPWARAAYDKVLLDPPRAGAREVLALVAASGATRIVYVSCHPASLARDAGLLVREHGFVVEAAGVMDMFPHTAHVESMAVFTRR